MPVNPHKAEKPWIFHGFSSVFAKRFFSKTAEGCGILFLDKKRQGVSENGTAFFRETAAEHEQREYHRADAGHAGLSEKTGG